MIVPCCFDSDEELTQVCLDSLGVNSRGSSLRTSNLFCTADMNVGGVLMRSLRWCDLQSRPALGGIRMRDLHRFVKALRFMNATALRVDPRVFRIDTLLEGRGHVDTSGLGLLPRL